MDTTVERGFLYRLTLTLVLTALVITGSTAWANHNFSDVPDGSFFGPAINEGAGAGCFTGFQDGTFKPAQNTTRGQFAFWLTNCGGRVVESSELTTVNAGANAQHAEVTVTAPAAGTGSGYLLIDSQTTASVDPASACPCGLWTAAMVNEVFVPDVFAIDTVPAAPGVSTASVSESVIHPIAAGETATVSVYIENQSTVVFTEVSTVITVTYVPFGFEEVVLGSPESGNPDSRLSTRSR